MTDERYCLLHGCQGGELCKSKPDYNLCSKISELEGRCEELGRAQSRIADLESAYDIEASCLEGAKEDIEKLERENAGLRASLIAVQAHCVCGASDGTRKLEAGE